MPLKRAASKSPYCTITAVYIFCLKFSSWGKKGFAALPGVSLTNGSCYRTRSRSGPSPSQLWHCTRGKAPSEDVSLSITPVVDEQGSDEELFANNNEQKEDADTVFRTHCQVKNIFGQEKRCSGGVNPLWTIISVICMVLCN